jgi:hypothetical protein
MSSGAIAGTAVAAVFTVILLLIAGCSPALPLLFSTVTLLSNFMSAEVRVGHLHTRTKTSRLQMRGRHRRSEHSNFPRIGNMQTSAIKMGAL